MLKSTRRELDQLLVKVEAVEAQLKRHTEGYDHNLHAPTGELEYVSVHQSFRGRDENIALPQAINMILGHLGLELRYTRGTPSKITLETPAPKESK